MKKLATTLLLISLAFTISAQDSISKNSINDKLNTEINGEFGRLVGYRGTFDKGRLGSHPNINSGVSIQEDLTGRYLSIGLGTGIYYQEFDKESWTIPSFIGIPLFIEGKLFFSKNKTSPFISASSGYLITIGNHGHLSMQAGKENDYGSYKIFPTSKFEVGMKFNCCKKTILVSGGINIQKYVLQVPFLGTDGVTTYITQIQRQSGYLNYINLNIGMLL